METERGGIARERSESENMREYLEKMRERLEDMAARLNDIRFAPMNLFQSQVAPVLFEDGVEAFPEMKRAVNIGVSNKKFIMQLERGINEMHAFLDEPSPSERKVGQIALLASKLKARISTVRLSLHSVRWYIANFRRRSLRGRDRRIWNQLSNSKPTQEKCHQDR